jgi:hypothetical protein
MRNYFVMQRYVDAPAKGTKFTAFNYPYGEHLMYADAVPLFTIPFKWFCNNIYDASAYTIPVFNVLIILNIILCGLLTYFVFNYVLKHRSFAWFMALILPWVNLQVIRIWKGHFSLSFSSIILLIICMLVLWDRYKATRSRLIMVALATCLLCIASFFVQPHYLPILTMFITGALLLYGWLTRSQPNGKFTMIAAIAIPVISTTVCYLFISLTDSLFFQRSAGILVDKDTKTIFSALHTAYPFYAIDFPFKFDLLSESDNPEKMAYLGNIALYSFTLILIAAVIRKSFRQQVVAIQKSFFADPFKCALVCGGVMCLLVSFGELYITGEQGYAIHNILNPFFYLHRITDATEHFNKLARFTWPFFWVFNIWMVYTLVSIHATAQSRVKYFIVTVVVIMGLVEVRDQVRMLKAKVVADNPLLKNHMQHLQRVKIDYSQYQAILPVPYYYMGAEQDKYVLPAFDAWATNTYQLAVHTGLPLMSSLMNRTNTSQGSSLQMFAANGHIVPQLASRLDNRPLLIAYNKAYAVADTSAPNFPADNIARETYLRSLEFPVRNGLPAVDSAGDIIFYAYYPK